uniref:PHD-type domain-containing protein n=1 Tax=Caenorhabditis tropicalis TaxID=1561998 RepID=A0A1I7TM41_9PELO
MLKKEKETRKKLKYDPNEGLLPEIRKTCGYPEFRKEQTPPARGSGKKKKPVEEKWKWPEAQTCAICSIGGDILCCEKCPASFHLACLGLEASDIPDDSFYCNRCEHLPEGVQLFPPEKCSSTVNPHQRIETEVERNKEAIRYQYERMKKEEDAKQTEEKVYGPPTFMEAIQNIFPDKTLIKALAMGNPMDFTLSEECQAEREFYPNDSMEEKRPHIVGEICDECHLSDDWTQMLQCNYCPRVFHRKCVYPPLITIPRMAYWRCPRHLEARIDSIYEGVEVSKEKKKQLYLKHANVECSFKTFEAFCKATEKLRMESKIKEVPVIEEVFYGPGSSGEPSISSVLIPKKSNLRKGGRGKKKNDTRFLSQVYSLLPDKATTSKAPKISQKPTESTEPVERNDQELDKLDEERSIKMTDEELVSSIMPLNESSRAEYLTQKLLGTDIESSANFLNRHESMIARSQTFCRGFAEKDLTKLMRKDLDPIETVRGSGVQSFSNLQDKSCRKKCKADVELLVQGIGFGDDHANRKFDSARTEAFFRRNAPPPSAQNCLNPRSLRECVLNSQKEALGISNVYKYHPNPDDLENFILVAYDTSFKSAAQRDAYYVSSMSPWSKEPIAALTAKWAAEAGAADIIKSENIVNAAEQSETDPAEIKDSASEIQATDKPSTSTEESALRTSIASDDNVKEEEPEEEDGTERASESTEFAKTPREESSTPSGFRETSPVPTPPESPTAIIERLAKLDFKGLKMQDDYEKAESVFEAEGYFGEPDTMYPYGLRHTKSENDLVDRSYWPAVQKNLQTMVRRETQFESEHNYSSLYPAFYSDNEKSDKIFTLQRSASFEEEEKVYEDDQESSYSVEFAYPNTPPSYDNFADPPHRKRGRPVGSKNRKEGEAVTKRKRNSVDSITSSIRGRGRGGRPRGSRGRGGRRSGASSIDGGSRRQSQTLSSDGPESPESTSGSALRKLREEVEEAKIKYTKLMIARTIEESKNAYFETRDDMLLNWTAEQHQALRERCLAGRLSSLIPFEQRFFLPSQRVLARLDFGKEYLPVAIQRCLTKLGTANDCHVRLQKYTNVCCTVFAEYHCDIVREYHSNCFYLSTLATEAAIVNNVVVRRPELSQIEAAERTRKNYSSSTVPSNIRCECQFFSDQLIAHQENRGVSIKSGIVKLEDGAQIEIGCTIFTFKIL